jgi:hypothetical protein
LNPIVFAVSLTCPLYGGLSLTGPLYGGLSLNLQTMTWQLAGEFASRLFGERAPDALKPGPELERRET